MTYACNATHDRAIRCAKRHSESLMRVGRSLGTSPCTQTLPILQAKIQTVGFPHALSVIRCLTALFRELPHLENARFFPKRLPRRLRLP
ncbi:hypothetical protein K458DRAFT_119521 [Lentithecium fluviatile CBS 122367]|uniref:Uncharacterized protein n=1 Tax=Lentithecium fluviatile CBS 122367 TaxID=1168545 RepID=A0A6G1IMQ8_9PLEO|nr:hypothetical protein K458DRAFT_119521 [Lentithecium fluviatile CBS 122367]